MRKLLLLVIPLCILSCKKENGALQATTSLDVAYNTASAEQKMDIYLPAERNTTSTKVIILVHGGGWSSGDKTEFNAYIDTLKKRLPGYAIFNINYRLASGISNLFPTQENDVRSAIEYIYNKRQEFQVSDKFVMLGISAGAHLSLLQAYKNTSPVRIKAVVDFFGPTDLVDMYNNPASPLAPPVAVSSVVGATPTGNPVLYQQSSPVHLVTTQSPPTIILHGGMDVLVRWTQAEALRNKLAAMGVTHQYVFYPNENHGWTGANMVDSFDKIVLFLQANVN